VGEVDPSWPPPGANVEHSGTQHSDPELIAVGEVNPNWPPPVDASSGRAAGIWVLAALTTVVGIGVGVAVTLWLSNGGQSDQRQPPDPPAVAAPSLGVNVAPGPPPSLPPPLAQAPEAVELPVIRWDTSRSSPNLAKPAAM
jgi:hypothetical protein